MSRLQFAKKWGYALRDPKLNCVQLPGLLYRTFVREKVSKKLPSLRSPEKPSGGRFFGCRSSISVRETAKRLSRSALPCSQQPAETAKRLSRSAPPCLNNRRRQRSASPSRLPAERKILTAKVARLRTTLGAKRGMDRRGFLRWTSFSCRELLPCTSLCLSTKWRSHRAPFFLADIADAA